MELDEYEYLERAVEFLSAAAAKPSPPPATKPSRRSEEPKPPRRSEDRHGDRDERDRRSRHRSSRDDERDRDRWSRSREREYDDRHRRHRVRRSREYEEDVERERERERRRRSSSRHEREGEIERARSRERRARERESESMERRRFKEKKELESEADPERDQRTVFAYQMSLKATERDVYEFFSQAGKVRDVKLIMDRLSRRSKGVGYIEFYDAMSVPYAIALTNKLLLGQPVMVKASEAEKNLVQSTTTVASGAAGAGADRKIYVGNLHYNMTEVHLRQIFEAFGPLELVQLPLDPITGHCKGYGFIQFQQLEHAKSARHLNGTLDIAGRIIKVSAVTDYVGGQNAGTNVADFDDEDGSGLTLNARSRAILMQKLDRTGTATDLVESLGVPGLNGLVPNLPAASLPTNGVSLVPAIANAQHLPSFEPIGDPSECLLLKNMFDPSAETDPDFYSDVKEEVEDECSKFGPLRHIFVDRNSNGFVYLRFESVASAAGCQRAMHNRYYAGRSISATFMRPHDYDSRFRSDV